MRSALEPLWRWLRGQFSRALRTRPAFVEGSLTAKVVEALEVSTLESLLPSLQSVARWEHDPVQGFEVAVKAQLLCLLAEAMAEPMKPGGWTAAVGAVEQLQLILASLKVEVRGES